MATAVESRRRDLSLVPCLRRRKEDPIQSSEREPEINKLPDSLLLEILCRLPCQWALRCKSVSKHWLSLISHPYFIRCFIHHHHQHQFGKLYSSPFTLLLQFKSKSKSQKNIFVYASNKSKSKSEFFLDLDFLNFPFRVAASFNDLLLVRNNVKVNEYHICNPFTKECFSLPRLPHTDLIRRRNRKSLVGFICDPYSCDKHYGCFTNAHYRYKVLLIRSPTSESNTSDQSQLQMEIFSSETGEWCNSIVSVSLKLNPFGIGSILTGVVANNGKLYWVDVEKETGKIQGFVVFDPFKEEEQCRYINPPIDLVLFQPVFFGAFQGRLRMFQHLWCPRYSFFVWELEDEEASTWCMKHKVYLKHDLVHKVYLKHEDYFLSGLVSNDFLAFHPYNGEIVFLQSGNYIVLCNMRTMELKIERKLQNMPCILSSYFTKFVLLLLQPSWPTPIPPLPLKFGG
ncbi:F-box protein At3g26010-like [Fagus crenata]